MSHKFNPGDLALIVASILPELIGKTVELVRHVNPGERVDHEGLPWENVNDGCLAWLVCGSGLLRLDTLGRIAPCPVTLISESKLMPLHGDFAPLKQKSQAVPA